MRISIVSLLFALLLSMSIFAQHEGVETDKPIDGPKKSEVAPATPPVDFLRDVRPILSQNCYPCHGPDAARRKADLRFDQRESAFADRDGYPAIVAGDVAASLLFEMISTDDELDKMPPPDDADSLEPEEIEILRRWIEEGAEWNEHWSFVAPTRPRVSEHPEDVWARETLDHFVRKHLAASDLEPAAPADKETWLRRVTFDLTGLAPTIEELEAYDADSSAGAEAKVVDRLLASPRFGERQAQEWLDIARYADTNGYQRDSDRQVWKWREWVIHAFNENKRYDQFLIEQLAGDLLPEATVAQKIATGFNRNHPINSEAGEEPDEYRSAYVIDRVNTTATAFMGLTLACAQCHDHKYDPISQKDYYRFYDFFNHIDERDSGGGRNPRPSIVVPDEDQAPRVADLEKRLKTLEKRLEIDDPLSDAEQVAWEERTLEFIGDPIEWTTPEPIGMIAHYGSILRRLDDGSILSTGTTPVRDTYDLVLKPGRKKITAFRLEVLPDASQPEQGSGRATDGRFVLSGVKLRVSTLSDAQDPPLVSISRASADINQEAPEDRVLGTMFPGDIEGSVVVSEEPQQGFGRGSRGGWSIIGDERARPHEAVFLPVAPVDLNEVSIVHVSLVHNSRPYKSLIGRFRISYTEDERIREQLLPVNTEHWYSVGPFPAEDVAKAFTTEFEPQKEIAEGVSRKKKYIQPRLPEKQKSAEGTGKGGASSGKGGGGASPSGKGAGSGGGKSAGTVAQGSAKDATAATDSEEGAEKAVASSTTGKDASPAAGPGKKKSGKGKKKPSGEGASADAVAQTRGASPSDESKDPGEQGTSKKDTAKKDPPKPGAAGEKPKAEAAAKPEGAPNRRPPREVKLAWTEKRTWRDGRRFRIEGENAAYYLTRTIQSTRPRTATIDFTGGDGIQVWLNGKTILRAPPVVRSERGRGEGGGGGNGGFSQQSSSGGTNDRRVTIGLRKGANELVAKVVIAKPPPRRGRGGSSGGAPNAENANLENENPDNPNAMGGGQGNQRSRGGAANLTFRLDPEGEDVLDHEVITALRTLHRDELLPDAEIQFSSAETALETPSGPKLARSDLEKVETVSLVADEESPPSNREGSPPSEARMRKAVRKYFRENIDTVGRIIARERRSVERELAGLKRSMPQSMVMSDRDKPRETHVFIRGVYNQPGELVTAATPAVLPPMSKDLPRNRLGLAEWLVSPEHPLTARVAVNRVWQQYFGRGLVGTSGDFGIRGDMPSHPELLDWLAVEFRESGWDLKKLHRSIALSATYRQASRRDAELRERDPENQLLAAGPRQRLSAEMIRDHALSVSGLLVEEIGGPSVKPYQPEGLYNAVSGGRNYRQDKGEKQYRRGIYVYWKRGVPYPSFLTFDAPKRETCTMQRVKTTTPLQALVLLNDPVYVEAAKKLGERMLKSECENDLERIAIGFRLCTSRAPSERELEILAGLLATERSHFGENEEATAKLLKVGESKVDEKLDAAELAAWVSVARALLNLDATIHRG